MYELAYGLPRPERRSEYSCCHRPTDCIGKQWMGGRNDSQRAGFYASLGIYYEFGDNVSASMRSEQ